MGQQVLVKDRNNAFKGAVINLPRHLRDDGNWLSKKMAAQAVLSPLQRVQAKLLGFQSRHDDVSGARSQMRVEVS